MSENSSIKSDPQMPKSSPSHSSPPALPVAEGAGDTAKMTQDVNELQLYDKPLTETDKEPYMNIKVEQGEWTKASSKSKESQHSAPDQPTTHEKNKHSVKEVHSMDGSRHFTKIVFSAPKTVNDLLKLVRLENSVTEVFAADSTMPESSEIAWDNEKNKVVTIRKLLKIGENLELYGKISGDAPINDECRLLVEHEASVDFDQYKKLKEFLERPINEDDPVTCIPGIHEKFAGELKRRLQFEKAVQLLDVFKDSFNWNEVRFRNFLLKTFEDADGAAVRGAYIHRCVFALRLHQEWHPR